MTGSFCFAELCTPDLARSRRFYQGMFGWTVAEAFFQRDGRDAAGLRVGRAPLGPGGAPAQGCKGEHVGLSGGRWEIDTPGAAQVRGAPLTFRACAAGC